MTVITLTRAEVEALKPCSLDKLDVFKGRNRLNAREALEAGASVDDLLWVAGKLGLKRECVQFAVAVAERVAHLNPDPRVGAALDAARAWLADPSDDKRAAAFAAGRAARAAAYATKAVIATPDTAATYAARAANAAAFIDTTAFYAATYAARAASRDAAEREAQRGIFISIFCPEDQA